MEVSDKEIQDELHETIKQFFDKHREFKTYGDALDWMHKSDFDTVKNEVGSLGLSKFSTEILWLISVKGPNAIIDFDLMATKKRAKNV